MIKRSALWCHGGIEDARKMAAGAADAISFDLEDSVPAPMKAAARKRILDIFAKVDFGSKMTIIRVNGIGSDDYYKDMMEVIAVALPKMVKVPKVDTVQDMLFVDAQLAFIEKMKGLPLNSIEVHASIESLIGIRNVYDIASCCPRVTSLGCAMEDLSRSMHVTRRYKDNELDLLYIRQKFVMDVLAAGKHPYDACLLVDSPEANERATRMAKQMGFSGRSTRSEEDAVLANKVFGVDEEELRVCKGQIAAWEEHEREHRTGEPYFEGQVVCFAAYKHAQDVVALAKVVNH